MAVNIPEKTVSDGDALIKGFYELVSLRAPHKPTAEEEELIKSFKDILKNKPKTEVLADEARDLFQRLYNVKINWESKEMVCLMEAMGLIGYLESKYSGRFDRDSIEAKSKLTSLAASLGDEAASEYIITGDNLTCYKTLKKTEIKFAENRQTTAH